MRLSALRLPYFVGGDFFSGVVVGKTRTLRRSENDLSRRHCERQRSNPVGLRGKLDCFVALLLAMTRLGWGLVPLQRHCRT
jgi:hypothetical protein